MKRVLIILIIGSLALPSLAQRRGGQQQTVQRGSAFSQETIIIRPYQIVREEIIITPDMLVLDRRNIYKAGVRLNQDEVRTLMTGMDALRLYNRGIRRTQNGNIVAYSGLGAIGVGGLTLWIGNRWQTNTAGGVLMGAGVIAGITGLVMRNSGRHDFYLSVNSFNRNLNTNNQTTLDLRFDVTPNGVGLVLNF